MTIKEVTTAADVRNFHRVQFRVYKNDPAWVAPLFKEIEEIFTPEKNAYFQTGQASRWLVMDDKGECAGRVAAFYSQRLMGKDNEGIGGIGFFECIDDAGAANLLFDAAEAWLISQGMTGADAPINFGERDKYWGLLVEGERDPSYQESYNPLYYRSFFEARGYEKLIEQSTSTLRKASFNKERFGKLAQRVLQNSRYHYENYKSAQKEKYAADFVAIYNKAWANHEGFSPITKVRVLEILSSLEPILEEDIIIFGYADGMPASIYVNIIQVNDILGHLRGELNLWSKLRFWWLRKTKPVKRIRGTVFGVIPECHNTGIETGMIWHLYETTSKRGDIEEVELAWIGDFNPKMHSMLHSLGAEKTKVHYTYRKMFN